MDANRLKESFTQVTRLGERLGERLATSAHSSDSGWTAELAASWLAAPGVPHVQDFGGSEL